MSPNTICSNLRSLQDAIAQAAEDWTVAICSPNNELIAMGSVFLPSCHLATQSIAELLARVPPDLEQLLVICDDDLADGGALELMHQLRHHLPQATCRFLAYLPQTTAPERLAALHSAGLDALCSKRSGGSGTVLRALIQALHGQQTVDAHFRAPLQQARSRALTPRSGHPQEPDLSPRERELIQLLGRGHNATQIAALQQKRRDTIRRQLSLLYRKTGVSDQRGLIAWSIAQGLIRPLDLVAAAPPAASEPGFPAADGNRRRNLATHH